MGEIASGDNTNLPVLEAPAPALSHGFGGDTDDMLSSVCPTCSCGLYTSNPLFPESDL